MYVKRSNIENWKSEPPEESGLYWVIDTTFRTPRQFLVAIKRYGNTLKVQRLGSYNKAGEFSGHVHKMERLEDVSSNYKFSPRIRP